MEAAFPRLTINPFDVTHRQMNRVERQEHSFRIVTMTMPRSFIRHALNLFPIYMGDELPVEIAMLILDYEGSRWGDHSVPPPDAESARYDLCGNNLIPPEQVLLAAIPEQVSEMWSQVKNKILNQLQGEGRVCRSCPETGVAGHRIPVDEPYFSCRRKGCRHFLCERALAPHFSARDRELLRDISDTPDPDREHFDVQYCSKQCEMKSREGLERVRAGGYFFGDEPPEIELAVFGSYCDICDTTHETKGENSCIFMLCSVCHKKTCVERVFYPELHFPAKDMWFCSLWCLENIEVYLPFKGEDIVAPGHESSSLLMGYSADHITQSLLDTTRRNRQLHGQLQSVTSRNFSDLRVETPEQRLFTKLERLGCLEGRVAAPPLTRELESDEEN